MKFDSTIRWASAVLALNIVSACGAKSTNTSVESSDERSAELRDSFQCNASAVEHSFDRSAQTLIYSFYSTGMMETSSLSVYGDGRVVAHNAIQDGTTKERTQSLSAEELRALLFELVDRTCLLSITESSVNAKIKTINASYEAAHPGKASYGKPRKADCLKPKITVALDSKEYSSAFDSCNSFNTYLDDGTVLAEEKFVTAAHIAALNYLDELLTAP